MTRLSESATDRATANGGAVEDAAAEKLATEAEVARGVEVEVLLDGIEFPGQIIAAVCGAVEATLTFRVLAGKNQTMVTARQDVPITRDTDGAAALTADFLRGQLKRLGFSPVGRF